MSCGGVGDIEKLLDKITGTVQGTAKKVQQRADKVVDSVNGESENVIKGGLKPADPSVVANALSDFQSKSMKFGSDTFLLDKSGMKHILERHHPKYWDGSVKQAQSFFDKNMSINDISSAIQGIMRQNRDILRNKGTTGMYQITGTYDGVEYVVGFKNGLVGQFYPK